MKIKYFFMALCLGLALVGCKHKQTKESYLPPASMDYSAADTARIMSLVNQYITCLNNQDYDGMVDLLYVFKDNNVHPYTESQRDSVINGLSQIPVYAAKLNSLILRSNVNNEVGITIQLIPDGDLEEGIGTSKFFLNPVVVDGEWYLTLLDTHAEGYRHVN